MSSVLIDPSWKRLDLSVPIHELPRWVWTLSVILFLVPLIPYALLYGLDRLLYGIGTIWVVLGFVLFIVLHELVHAIGWKFASGLPWSAFRFGIAWRAAAPYCHAKQPMSVQAYRIGAGLPLVVTGVLPWLVGLALADAALTFIGATLIMGAVGDIYVLWSLRDVPASAQVMDHESNAGCVVYLNDTHTIRSTHN